MGNTKRKLRAENLRLREALHRIESYQPQVDHPSDEWHQAVRGCFLCRSYRERGWPPSGLCDEHYRERHRVDRRNERRAASQHLELKQIARRALSGGEG